MWAPEQMHKLGFRHRSEYVKDREAMRGMTYDEEVRVLLLLLVMTPGLLVVRVMFRFGVASELDKASTGIPGRL